MIKKVFKSIAFVIYSFTLIVLSICIFKGFTNVVAAIEEPDKEVVEVKQSEYNNKEAIVNWVLNNSYRISRQTAEGIVNVSALTNNGLLLIAVASRESSFSPTAISNKGAIGLNQVMPSVWVRELKKEGIIKERKDLFDYDKNLLASNYILTKYYNSTGSWRKALRKYVGGKHNTYIKDIMSVYGELQLLENTK